MEDSRNSTSRPVITASETYETLKISEAVATPSRPIIPASETYETLKISPSQGDSVKRQCPCRTIFIILGVVGAIVLLVSALVVGVLLGMDRKTSKIESGKPESC